MAKILKKDKEAPFPSPEEFFLSIPLYEAFSSEDSGFFSLEYFEGTIDTYCEGCGRHSVFSCKKKEYQSPPYLYQNYTFSHHLTCSRNNDHKLFFYFLVDRIEVMKIGQYPSLADLTKPELQKYRKILGEQFYREFIRSIGLISHGIGIGAFVYLRRIFESLIEKAHLQAQLNKSWTEEIFQASRMDEKIALLKEYLPSFLVENKSLYGILSKGIHDLTEEECLDAFPIVKLGVELILDEKLEQFEKEEKIQSTRKNINELNSHLKK